MKKPTLDKTDYGLLMVCVAVMLTTEPQTMPKAKRDQVKRALRVLLHKLMELSKS